MQTTPEISYKNIEPTDRIRLRVDKEVQHLETVFPRLVSCKVLIEGPSGRRKSGELYRVRAHLGLPGGREIAVTQRADDNHAHEDVMVAIRDAFRAAERQLKKQKPDPRVEGAAGETRLAGKIARFIAGEPAGFIRGEDGRDYYFHAREATETAFDAFVIGDAVTFRGDDGDKGPLARAVHKRQLTGKEVS